MAAFDPKLTLDQGELARGVHVWSAWPHLREQDRVRSATPLNGLSRKNLKKRAAGHPAALAFSQS